MDETRRVNAGRARGSKPFDTVPVPAELPPGWVLREATSAEFDRAERLEYEVFVAIGYCEPSSTGRAEEFDPWREQSTFRIVVSPEGELAGVVRILFGRYEELPIGAFPKWDTYPPDPVLEYASLAVPDTVRGSGVAEALYRGVWQEAIRRGAGGIAGIGAPWLLRILNDTFDLGFEQLGEGRFYMGSDCIPVGISLADLLERLGNQPSFRAWALSEIDLRDVADASTRARLGEASQP